MIKSTKNIPSLFFFLAVISANLYPSQCSQIDECQTELHDSYYEVNRQELIDEIDDVNDYMKMVADQLTNDGVIIVRAVSTKIATSDIDDLLKNDSLVEGVENYDHLKDTERPEINMSGETGLQSIRENVNTASIGFKTETSSANFENDYKRS